MHIDDNGLKCGILCRDNDAKYVDNFDAVFNSSGCQMKRITPLSPILQAHVERVIQTLKHEVLNASVSIVIATWTTFSGQRWIGTANAVVTQRVIICRQCEIAIRLCWLHFQKGISSATRNWAGILSRIAEWRRRIL